MIDTQQKIDMGLWMKQGTARLNAGEYVAAISCFKMAAKSGGSDPRIYYSIAHAYLSLGLVDKAIKELSKIIEKNPEHSSLYADVGQALLRQNKFGKAETFFRKAVDLVPNSASVRVLLGEALRWQNRLEEAEASIRKALDQDPKSSQAFLRLGEILQQQGKLEEAETSIRKVLDLDPESSQAFSRLGELLEQQGQLKEATAVYKTYLGMNVKDPSIYFVAARLYQRLGKVKEMQACFKKYAEFEPRDIIERFRRFQALAGLMRFEEAFCEAENILDADWGQISISEFIDEYTFPSVRKETFYEAQLRILERSRNGKHAWPWYYFYRGFLMSCLSDAKETLSYFDWMTKLHVTRYGWMRYVLANVKLETGDCIGAVNDYQVALQSRPNDWLIHCKLGELHLILGKQREAFREFDLVDASTKDNPKARGDMYAWRGELNLWLGNYEEAIHDFDEALKLGTQFAYCWRGGANLKLGRMEQAIVDLDHAIRIRLDVEAFVWRGEAKRLIGNYQQALHDLNRAIGLDAGMWAFFNRALVYAAVGDHARMRRDFYKIPENIIRYIQGKIGLGHCEKLKNEQVQDVLRAGLELSLGNRRQEIYVLPVWMKVVCNQ